MGKILAICISKQRGVQKKPINEAKVIADWGIEHDAHGGDWHRQVSLLSADKIEDFRKNGVRVGYGAFGENLVVSGLDFAKLSVGTLLRAGEVLLEMTKRMPCTLCCLSSSRGLYHAARRRFCQSIDRRRPSSGR